jgi:hypothetical protein
VTGKGCEPVDADREPGSGTSPLSPSRMAALGDQEALIVANEFAEVFVRRVPTRNGVRLEVSSPRLHRAIRLDPLQLEALTWQGSATFSAMLSEPFGPSPGASYMTSEPSGDADDVSRGPAREGKRAQRNGAEVGNTRANGNTRR